MSVLHRFPHFPLALVVALATAACAGTTSSPDPAAAPTRIAVRPITDTEIARLGVTSAWEAIERLRPNWLRQRARSAWGNGLPMVYVNNLRQGTADELRWLHVQRIQRIEFFSPGDATTLWGIDHPNGAIQIVEYR